jgi:hypothetical protein
MSCPERDLLRYRGMGGICAPVSVPALTGYCSESTGLTGVQSVQLA